eukprot:4192513-Lingulodinium_polyedra.AAC.1
MPRRQCAAHAATPVGSANSTAPRYEGGSTTPECGRPTTGPRGWECRGCGALNPSKPKHGA